MLKKHKVKFIDFYSKSNNGSYSWFENFPIQDWKDQELLDYFWEITKVQSELKPNPVPHRDLINLIVEIDRRGLVNSQQHIKNK